MEKYLILLIYILHVFLDGFIHDIEVVQGMWGQVVDIQVEGLEAKLFIEGECVRVAGVSTKKERN